MKLIAYYNNMKHTIDYSFDEKWIEIKTKLIRLFNLTTDYIDLEFTNERPIREFGKQALLIGLLERIYDDYYVNEFITKSRELNFTIHITKLTNKEKEQVNKVKQTNCIFTENDFPLLK
jgi:hypothetical protein